MNKGKAETSIHLPKQSWCSNLQIHLLDTVKMFVSFEHVLNVRNIYVHEK